MTPAPTLATARLTLRQHLAEDFALMRDILMSARAAYMGGPFDLEKSWQIFAADTGAWALQGFGGWAMVETATGRIVGQIVIQHPAHYPEPEIGWLLLEGAEGQGFATEAAQAALDWARSAHGMTTLVSYVDPANAASIAVATRLGASRDAGAPLPVGETPDGTHVYRHNLAGVAACA